MKAILKQINQDGHENGHGNGHEDNCTANCHNKLYKLIISQIYQTNVTKIAINQVKHKQSWFDHN